MQVEIKPPTVHITRELVDRRMIDDLEPHRFFTEASTLGLKPGEWPRALTTDLGNGRPFIMIRCRDDGAHLYKQEFGYIQLLVWND